MHTLKFIVDECVGIHIAKWLHSPHPFAKFILTKQDQSFRKPAGTTH